jgi:2-amino-4-hydroxy-6-hydroxymethyldihydropteridine diphosphokinase
MHEVYLLLGSNLGDSDAVLSSARKLIAEHIGTIRKMSSVYETEPWGFIASKYFLNQALWLNIDLKPEELLRSTQSIEEKLGRIRSGKGYKSRIIDIDILFYNDIIIDTGELKIPHPRLQERMFTLKPLGDINPDLIHPVYGLTINELIHACNDHSIIRLYKKYHEV